MFEHGQILPTNHPRFGGSPIASHLSHDLERKGWPIHPMSKSREHPVNISTKNGSSMASFPCSSKPSRGLGRRSPADRLRDEMSDFPTGLPAHLHKIGDILKPKPFIVLSNRHKPVDNPGPERHGVHRAAGSK